MPHIGTLSRLHPKSLGKSHPRSILGESKYERRLGVARDLVVNAVRHLSSTPFGAGFCTEVTNAGRTPDELLNFLLQCPSLAFDEAATHPAQTQPAITRKWRSLFRRQDLFDNDYFKEAGRYKESVVNALVLECQTTLLRDAIDDLIEQGDLAYVNDAWTLTVTAVDQRRLKTHHDGHSPVKRNRRH